MLLIGFDSAWTARRAGAVVGAIREADGSLHGLGLPQVAGFPEAAQQILTWQRECEPGTTIVMLDQPTIVTRATGQRPVENIVAGPVGRRYGAVQPANTSRLDMFGEGAPLWPFLQQLGGAADPREPVVGTRVFETYPVLTMIALGWMRPDARPAGRLPKYNPERRTTFVLEDWRYVCSRLGERCLQHGLFELLDWATQAAANARPRKADQDGLDACICLLAAIHLGARRECLMVGDTTDGYILVPSGPELRDELEARCVATGRHPADYVRSLYAG
jgi:predicted RNase H-like nuclease